jgi:LPS export ABC transporter protein LptC
MINTVRRVLLLVAFSVIGLAGFYFLKNLDTSINIGNVKLKVMEDGVDVEIENFMITHENKGVKEWELKADLAQVDNRKNLTTLKNVEMTLHKGGSKQYVISADSGVYKKTTEDVSLNGNVKLVGPAEGLKQRLSIAPKKSN